MKHKHCELIMAWANGEKIQIYDSVSNEWLDWTINGSPNWGGTTKYRIKPETKPDEVRYFSIGRYDAVVIEQWQMVLDKQNIKATFDGETGLLKSVEMYERIN